MYKPAVLLLLLGLQGSDAINLRDKFHQQAAQTKWARQCSVNVDNFKSQQSLDYSSIAEQGWRWTDPTAFAYNNESSYNEWFYWEGQTDLEEGIDQQGSTTYWLQAMSTPAIEGKSMYGTDLKDFNDIRQGGLGDCYYLAGISALAENRYRLQHSIVTDTLNDAGIFTMRVYIKGVPATISVDDYIPFGQDWSGAYVPKFAKAGEDSSIWGMLMEKVWAKINGNYEYIISGMAGETYAFLGGCPVTGYATNDASGINWSASKAYEIVANGNQKNYMMSAGCCNKDSGNEAVDLFPGHAYTALGAVTVWRNGEEVQLLLIRNPWGSQTYNGTWGATNHWNMWDDETTSQAPQYAASSGNFYITAQDFVNYFDEISVGFFIDTYVNNFLEVRMCDVGDQETRTYYVTFDQDAGETYMGVQFYNMRMYPKGCEIWDTKAVITVTSEQGTQLYNKQVWSVSYNGFKYMNLPSVAAGTYTVTVAMFWNSAVDVPDYTVRVYTDQKVTIGAATGQYGSWNYAIDGRNGTVAESDPSYSPPTECVAQGGAIVPYKPIVFTPAESAVEPIVESAVESIVESVVSYVEPEPTVEPEPIVDDRPEPSVTVIDLPQPNPQSQIFRQELSYGFAAFESNLPYPTDYYYFSQYFSYGMTTRMGAQGQDGWLKYTSVESYKTTITVNFPNNGGEYAVKGSNNYCYGDSTNMICICTIEGANDSCEIGISGFTRYTFNADAVYVWSDQWTNDQWW